MGSVRYIYVAIVDSRQYDYILRATTVRTVVDSIKLSMDTPLILNLSQ